MFAKALKLSVAVLLSFNLNNLTFAISHLTTFADDAEENGGIKYTYHLQEGMCSDAYDPYERLNRKVFVFNAVLDHFLLRPIAVGYRDATNDYTKARVGSFLSNLGRPLTTVNYLAQANLGEALKSFWQFMVNTTFGMGGMFDIAEKANLTTDTQTFGATLAYYGVAPGPYVVLPFFGGTNMRDIFDLLFLNNFLNPVKHYVSSDFRLLTAGIKMVDDRMKVLPFTDFVAKHSVDPYVAVRSAIHQNREASLNYPKHFVCPQ